MSSVIEFIRKRYGVPAKIGRIVTYQGHPYRIAWTSGTGLLLRSELIVHPTDPALDYSAEDNRNEVDRLKDRIKLKAKAFDNLVTEYEQHKDLIQCQEAQIEQLQHDLRAMTNERTFAQNDLDDAQEEIDRLKQQARLWDSLKHQLELYRESYSDLHNENHPYIPKMLDLMATLAEHIK